MSRAEELRDLLARATARPWVASGWESGNEHDGHPVWCHGQWIDGVFVGRAALTERAADARLIAAAVNAIPDLLAVVDAARERRRLWGEYERGTPGDRDAQFQAYLVARDALNDALSKLDASAAGGK